MNRIVVIGNGFDKAHGLATGYKDFINNYWDNFWNSIYDEYDCWQMRRSGVIKTPRSYEDEFVFFEVFGEKSDRASIPSVPQSCSGSYGEVIEFLSRLNEEKEYSEDYEECNFVGSVRLVFKNEFFEHISKRCSLVNWVDIENEYYGQLKELLDEDNVDVRNEKVQTMNKEFNAIKEQLGKYLAQIVEQEKIQPINSIRAAFSTLIELEDVAYCKQELFFRSIQESMMGEDFIKEQSDIEKATIYRWIPSRAGRNRHYLNGRLQEDSFRKEYLAPGKTLFLNFNYTSTAKRLYVPEVAGDNVVIDIHGQLGDACNPVIFGYGDELDEDYKRIEKLQNNDFLENIKSVCYYETGNYRNLLGFIESEPYQVFIMGHSCGNSDRTLLNTLFEHRNCISVKVYYHQFEEGGDNYDQLICNLSRNFNDRAAMRDKIVNKTRCLPLVPLSVDPRRDKSDRVDIESSSR